MDDLSTFFNKGEKQKMDNAIDLNTFGLSDFFNQTKQSSPEVTPISQEEAGKPDILQIDKLDYSQILMKLKSIEKELNTEYVEREDLVRVMLLSLVSGENTLLLGPPGSAKSEIIQELCKRIENANYFQWMLNKTSDPSEILGPYSVKQMENDKFVRDTTGMLPEAHIAFLDEVYKSNGPVLNKLLTIMNEHIFHNDGKAVPVPLLSLFGASNEGPDDESLNALHDRFIFRINVEYVHDAANKKRMHEVYLKKRNSANAFASVTTLTLDEIKFLKGQVCDIIVSKDIINRFVRLIDCLERNYAIHVSDRRQNECLKVMQASAVIGGRREVTLNDFEALTYVLWDKQEQLVNIKKEIESTLNPFDEQFASIKKNFYEIKENLAGKSSSVKTSERKALSRILTKMNKLINEAYKVGKDVDKFNIFREEVMNYNEQIINSGFNTDDIFADTAGSDDVSENPFNDAVQETTDAAQNMPEETSND